MKTGCRILTALVVLVILVGVGLAVFVRYYLTEDRLQAMIIPPIQEALGRDVSIGTIDVSLFKGISVNDVAVKEADGSTDFLSVGSFVLRYNLMPLLQKELVVSEVRLENPSIEVSRDKNGVFNFSTLALLAEDAQAVAPKKEESAVGAEVVALPVALTVDTISVKNARFRFSDGMEELPSLEGKADLTLGVNIGQSLADLQVQGKGNFAVDALLKELKSAVSGTLEFSETQGVCNIDVEVQGEKMHLEVIAKNFIPQGHKSRRLPGSLVGLSGKDAQLSFIKEQNFELNVTSKQLNVDKLLALPAVLAGGADMQKKGKRSAASSQPSAPLADKLPPGLIAHGVVKVDKALYEKLSLENFQLAYRLENNIFTIKDLTGKTAGGEIKTNMIVDLNDPDLSYKGNMDVSSLAMDQLQAALFSHVPTRLAGNLSTGLDFSGSGMSWPVMRDRLIATGDFSFVDGQITNSEIAASVAQILRLDQLKDVVFDDFSGNLKISDGNVMQKTSFDGRDFDMTSEGRIGLDSTLDLPLHLVLSPELSERLKKKISFADHLTDDSGQTNLQMQVTGTFADPQVALDMRAAQKELKKTLVDKAFKELDRHSKKDGEKDAGGTEKESEPSLEDAGKNLLKGFFGQ